MGQFFSTSTPPSPPPTRARPALRDPSPAPTSPPNPQPPAAPLPVLTYTARCVYSIFQVFAHIHELLGQAARACRDDSCMLHHMLTIKTMMSSQPIRVRQMVALLKENYSQFIPREEGDVHDVYYGCLEQLADSNCSRGFAEMFPFGLLYERICSSEDCEYRYTCRENFREISLGIEDGSLMEALEKFTRRRINAECIGCGEKRAANLAYKFTQAPPFLVFTLNRHMVGGVRHSSTQFDAPLQLDIKPFFSSTDDQERIAYKLVAVVFRTGDVRGGRYWPAVKANTNTSMWLEFEDTNIKTIEQYTVADKVRTSGYMLFYHKCESNQNSTQKAIIPRSMVDISRVQLGAGGQATVYKGTYKNAEVAVKVFKSVMRIEDVLYTERELVHLTTLTHPNVTSLYGVTQHGPRVGVLLELAACDLHHLVVETSDNEGKTLPPADMRSRFSYLKDAAKGLAYMHSVGVVHLDVKPLNILIYADGTAKVSDFGLATLINTLVTHTSMPGTPAYMPPEAFRRTRASKANDIWAFGITILEVLIGTHAYINIIMRDGNIPMPKEFFSNKLPQRLDLLQPANKRVLLQMLNYDPAKRIQYHRLVDAVERLT